MYKVSKDISVGEGVISRIMNGKTPNPRTAISLAIYRSICKHDGINADIDQFEEMFTGDMKPIDYYKTVIHG